MDSVTAGSSTSAPWQVDPKYGGMSPESAEKSYRAGQERRATEEAWEREHTPKSAALKLTYFDECRAFTRRRWILKGIVARGETSAWIAPPGAGKSALLTEISVHCAAGHDWRGHRSKDSCGVVIFAIERADLYKRRLVAYQQRDDLEGLPIAVADAVINLLDPACVELIASTVHNAKEQFGCDVGLLVIDTYSKGIAAGGGDEDRAKDHNRAAVNLRNLHARLDTHIALVGHTGKDEARGARGSNAHLGDVDLMIQISGDLIKVAEVVKGSAGASGVPLPTRKTGTISWGD
jgi:AAA domain